MVVEAGTLNKSAKKGHNGEIFGPFTEENEHFVVDGLGCLRGFGCQQDWWSQTGSGYGLRERNKVRVPLKYSRYFSRFTSKLAHIVEG